MTYLLGVDLGTSGTKTVLFDENGTALASASQEYPLYQPKNGWSEQEPEDWWQAARDTIRRVIEKSGVNGADIACLSISGQMHGLVPLDGEGHVVRRALLWNDGRTQAECDEIHARVGKERLIGICGNPALTGFTAGKILWIRNHEPENFAKIRKVLLPKDYVRYRLTGELHQEISDASGTNLLDLRKREWSGEILAKLELDPGLLPPLCESTEIAGFITQEAAKETGLKAGMPVAGGGGDNMCGAVGTGVVRPGQAFTTIGTSGVVYAHSRELQIQPEGRVHAFISAVPGEYVNFGCALSAGLCLRWYRDTFCQAEKETAAHMGIDPYELMTREAAQSPLGANRLLFLPYLMGERSPLMDNNARGAFVGISAIHEKRDFLRSLMEGVMYMLRHNVDTLSAMAGRPEEMLLCGGGARSPFWQQMASDIFRMPTRTLQTSEGPALGAAILSGVACGLYPDVPTACGKLVKMNDPLPPDPAAMEGYEPYYRLFLSLYPALKDSYAALSRMN